MTVVSLVIYFLGNKTFYVRKHPSSVSPDLDAARERFLALDKGMEQRRIQVLLMNPMQKNNTIKIVLSEIPLLNITCYSY